MDDKICGVCKHSLCSPGNNGNKSKYYCDNEDSDNYGYPTNYDDGCEDFEEDE